SAAGVPSRPLPGGRCPATIRVSRRGGGGWWWRSAAMSTLTRTLKASTFFLALSFAPFATAAFAEPALTLTDDGTTFVYKARPGDQPGSVAAMFGIAQRDMPAFFAANGITD